MLVLMADEISPNQDDRKPGPISGETVVKSLVAGAAAAVGTQTGPEVTILAAAASPFVEASLTRPIRRMAELVHRFGERAAAERGVDVAAFAVHLEQHPQAAALLADAGLAAARTDYEVKVEAIGQAIADGVLYEEGVIFDREAMMVRIICNLERTDVSVLEQIVRTPHGVSGAVVERQLPRLAGVTDKIIAELVATGLVRPRLSSRSETIGSRIRRVSLQGGDVLDELARVLDERTAASETEQFETTATGVLVMKRFLNAGEATGRRPAMESTAREGESREYVGPVVPPGTSWFDCSPAMRGHPVRNQSRQDSSFFVHGQPSQRHGWVTTDERCPTCSTKMIAEAVFNRYVGSDSESSVSGANYLCLHGCQ